MADKHTTKSQHSTDKWMEIRTRLTDEARPKLERIDESLVCDYKDEGETILRLRTSNEGNLALSIIGSNDMEAISEAELLEGVVIRIKASTVEIYPDLPRMETEINQ